MQPCRDGAQTMPAPRAHLTVPSQCLPSVERTGCGWSSNTSRAHTRCHGQRARHAQRPLQLSTANPRPSGHCQWPTDPTAGTRGVHTCTNMYRVQWVPIQAQGRAGGRDREQCNLTAPTAASAGVSRSSGRALAFLTKRSNTSSSCTAGPAPALCHDNNMAIPTRNKTADATGPRKPPGHAGP
jgi:hypothetical protein